MQSYSKFGNDEHGFILHGMASYVLQTWPEINPQESVNWMMQEFNDNRISSTNASWPVFLYWSTHDPSGTKTWLEQEQSRKDLTKEQKEFVDHHLSLMRQIEQVCSEQRYEKDASSVNK